MASLNDYSNNAKILCPYFKMQYKCSVQCAGIFDNQKTTTLNFNNEAHKTSHIYSFCSSKCWEGCPLALLIEERMIFSNDT